MHVAVAPVVTHTNPVGINATGSATWPGRRFHDMPLALYAEVRDRRWHNPKCKSQPPLAGLAAPPIAPLDERQPNPSLICRDTFGA